MEPRPSDPRELWKWMDAYESKTGGNVLAIAHNGNLSNGTMFPIVETFGCQASRSIQHSLYGIADVVLSSYQEIADITLSLHERPYRPVDLFTAGIENPDDLFVAVEEPVGVIEVTVEREER